MTTYPTPANPAVSKRMRANRRRDTGPEIAIRSALHQAGMRFFVDRPVRLADRTVRPDVVFPRSRVAVFVDGCFWHACPLHGSKPRHNSEYWEQKLQLNVTRDQLVDQALADADWLGMRFWEHEDPQHVAQQVVTAVDTRLATQASTKNEKRGLVRRPR